MIGFCIQINGGKTQGLASCLVCHAMSISSKYTCVLLGVQLLLDDVCHRNVIYYSPILFFELYMLYCKLACFLFSSSIFIQVCGHGLPSWDIWKEAKFVLYLLLLNLLYFGTSESMPLVSYIYTSYQPTIFRNLREYASSELYIH